MSNLIDENKQLRRQLKAYMVNAANNEQKQQRFQRHELNFISANGIQKLLSALFVDYKQDFQLDALTLTIVDREYEVRRIMENTGVQEGQYPDLIFCDSLKNIKSFFKTLHKPRLGKCTEEYRSMFFPASRVNIASMAIFPLVRHNTLIGTLNIGSQQEERYLEGTATDFLDRLTLIVAVCLENTINYEKVKLLGLIDPLTGVHNRRYFDQRLNEEINLVYRKQQPLSCLFIDIDHFKRFNDTYGHHIGDVVLREVASSLKKQMRTNDILSRYGGEEFAVLLTQTSHDDAMEIAERIRLRIEELQTSDGTGQPLKVTVSIGCTTLYYDYPGGLDISTSELLGHADSALYAAKEAGRNQVIYHPMTSGNAATKLSQEH